MPVNKQAYIRRELTNPKPNYQRDLKVLGFVGASELMKSRAAMRGHVNALNTARVDTMAPHGVKHVPKPSVHETLAAKKGDPEATAKVKAWVAMKQQSQSISESKHLQGQAQKYGDPLFEQKAQKAGFGPSDNLAMKTLNDLATGITGFPAGVAYTVKHPSKALTGMGQGFVETAKHPLRHPGYTLLNAWALASLDPGLTAAARAGTVGEFLKSPLKPRPAATRSLEINGVTSPMLGSRNPLTAAIQKNMDKGAQAKLSIPTNMNIGSSDAKFGRGLSRKYESEIAHQSADANAFARFEHGKTKLTPEEEKAYEIIANAQTAENYVQAHIQAAKDTTALGDVAGTEGHQYHAVMSKTVGDLVRNPSKNLQASLDEGRALIADRERKLGFTPDEIAHSIGKKHDEINALKEGRPSLASQLADATSPEAAAPISQQLVDVGNQAISQGAFWTPTKLLQEARGTPPATLRSPGPYGLGPPQIPNVRKSYTGSAFRGGQYRTDIVRLITDASKQATKIHMAQNVAWPTFKKLAVDTQEAAGGAKFAIPVRDTKKITTPHRQMLYGVQRDIPEQYTHQMDALSDHILPSVNQIDLEKNVVRNPDGTTDPVKWIDSRLIGGMLAKGGKSTVKIGGRDVSMGDLLDTINAVPRAATLYTKLSYAWNRVQQFLQDVSQQGIFMPANHFLLQKVIKDLPIQDYYAIKAAAGTGRSRILSPQAGILKKQIDAAANWWGKMTDDTSRELSWIHEARRAGYDTPEKIHGLLNDTSQAAIDMREHIKLRSGNEAIPFGKMSPVEKATLSRIFFFYPWMRASLEWTARFPGEHPVQAAVGAQVGAQGKDYTQNVLGSVLPGWAKGLVPITEGGTNPLTGNFSNINTPQTAVDVGEMIGAMGKPPTTATGTTFASELGPAGAGLYGLLTGTQRGRGSMAPWKAAAEGAISSISPMTFLTRLGPGKTYKGGWASAVGGFIAGAEAPRPTSKAQLQKSGLRELPTLEGLTKTIILDSQQVGLGPPPKEVLDDIPWKVKLDKALTKSKTDVGDAKAALKILDERMGSDYSSTITISTVGQAKAIVSAVRAHLYPRYSGWDNVIHQRIDANLSQQPVG